MKLETRNGITTRKDGLPYEVIKVKNGYQLRATGNPDKPVVIAETETLTMAITLLILQAPEGVIA